MKIKLNLSEANFLKWVMETFLDPEIKEKENKLIAQDILNKLNCGGSGTNIIRACNECGSENQVGEYKGKDICFSCWAKKLTDKDIAEL